MRTTQYVRRLALGAAVAVMPLSILTAVPATTAAPAQSTVSAEAPVTQQQADAAEREAVAAEREADRAEAAVPAAKARIKPALERARHVRKRVRKAQKPVKRLQKRVKNVKKPKVRKKVRQRLRKRRQVLRNVRRQNNAAWAAWNNAKKEFADAGTYAEQARRTAEEARKRADRLRAGAAKVTSVSVDALPPIHQPGTGPASAAAARNVVVVGTTPAIAHLPVQVEARVSGSWTTVGSAETGPGGVVHVPVARHDEYRAVVKGVTSAPDALSHELEYSEEFSAGRLGDDWHHRMQDYHKDGFRACSKGDPRATSMGEGTLQLWAKRDPDRKDKCWALRKGKKEGPYSYRLNGHVSTEKSFDFTYGIAAARMKFQDSPEGQHASFWLQPTQSLSDVHLGPEHTGAEIDVIEYFGSASHHSSGMAQFTYHNEVDARGQVTRVKTGGLLEDVERFLADKDDNWHERYHVFSVEWTPQEYIFRIDGQESWRSSVGVSHVPQFLILSMLSSDYAIAAAGEQGEKELGRNKAEVDWVRVWQ